MIAVARIIANFLRENRWPVLLLFAWLLVSYALFGGFAVEKPNPEDAVFFLRQQSAYIVVFVVFLTPLTLFNDRKSRRIVMVLSRSIRRWQYLLGVIGSSVFVALVYCGFLALAAGQLLQKSGRPAPEGAFFLGLSSLLLAILSGSLSVLFATFVNAYFASGITAAVLGVLAMLPLGGETPLLPVGPIVRHLFFGDLHSPWKGVGALSISILVWSVLIAALAAAIFSRVDISVAAE